MNAFDYYLNAFKNNYANFEGRARRSEYWYFALFNVIAVFVAMGLDAALGTNLILYFVYVLASFLPGLSIAVRRLHDTNRSGWWLLIAFVPLIGAIALLVFYCQDSDPGNNEYGPNPKNPAVAGNDIIDHLVD